MDNQRLDEQLDRVIQAILATESASLHGAGAAGNGQFDAEVAPLVMVAENLRALPREDFKSQLKADLERSTNMASAVTKTVDQAHDRATSQSKAYRTITPYLSVRNAPALLEFVQRVFGAQVVEQQATPSGGLHAEVRIGNSALMMGGAPQSEGPWFPAAIHLKVNAVDQVYARALEAGATSLHAPQDFDYGERGATVKDSNGNSWYLATPQGKTHWLPEMADATIYLSPKSSADVIDFAKHAFGAEELMREASGGAVHHAKIRIGDSVVEMGDAHGDTQPMAMMFYLHVPDVNEWYERALKGGATSLGAPALAPYGDYVGSVVDPFGNRWYMASPAPKADAQTTAEAGTKVSYIRPGFRTLTPYLIVSGAAKEIEFMKAGLGATEKFRIPGGPGRIMHAQLQIGEAVVELSDGTAEFPPRSSVNILYVDDPDAAYARAVAAGAKGLYEPSDRPFGDRDGVVISPGGEVWCLSNRGPGEHITKDTPSLVTLFTVKNASGYVDFLKRAFGATDVFEHRNADILVHTRLKIGDSILAGGEAHAEHQRAPFLMHMYVPDVDAVYAKAVEAGATTVQPLNDAPYGDRVATVSDPVGNLWTIATHIRDVRP
jgi:PhnB protein